MVSERWAPISIGWWKEQRKGVQAMTGGYVWVRPNELRDAPDGGMLFHMGKISLQGGAERRKSVGTNDVAWERWGNGVFQDNILFPVELDASNQMEQALTRDASSELFEQALKQHKSPAE